MAAFGAVQGTSKSQPATPDREGKGHAATGEAPRGTVDKGISPEGIKGSGSGFGK